MRYRGWRMFIFLAAPVLPLFWLYQGLTSQLGPDPGKALVDNLGLGALVLLLITLCMTPLRRMTGWAGWLAVRRQLGLWCFFYASLHLCGYLFFILGLHFDRLLAEVTERPYIIVGLLAFIGLLLMAVTSNRFSIRRLGWRWVLLHRVIYLVLALALLHMLWIARSDLAEWALYAAAGAALMLMRLPMLSERLSASRKKMTKSLQ